MSASVQHDRRASHREEFAEVRGRQAKAELAPQVGASRLRDVAAEAAKSVSGNQRAVAIDLSLHEGHVSRQFKDGSIRLEQLEVLGPTFAVKFGEELIRQFSPLATPQARAMEQIREMRRRLDELAQVVEHLS